MAFKYGAHANLADMAANVPKGVPSDIYWNMINNPGMSFEQALDDYIETVGAIDDPLAGYGEDPEGDPEGRDIVSGQFDDPDPMVPEEFYAEGDWWVDELQSLKDGFAAIEEHDQVYSPYVRPGDEDPLSLYLGDFDAIEEHDQVDPLYTEGLFDPDRGRADPQFPKSPESLEYQDLDKALMVLVDKGDFEAIAQQLSPEAFDAFITRMIRAGFKATDETLQNWREQLVKASSLIHQTTTDLVGQADTAGKITDDTEGPGSAVGISRGMGSPGAPGDYKFAIENLPSRFYKTIYGRRGAGYASEYELSTLSDQTRLLFFLEQGERAWSNVKRGTAKDKIALEENYQEYLNGYLERPWAQRLDPGEGRDFYDLVKDVGRIYDKAMRYPDIRGKDAARWTTSEHPGDLKKKLWVEGLFGGDGTREKSDRDMLVKMALTHGGMGYYSGRVQAAAQRQMDYYRNIGMEESEIFKIMTENIRKPSDRQPPPKGGPGSADLFLDPDLITDERQS
jgi:hypothetical protein